MSMTPQAGLQRMLSRIPLPANKMPILFFKLVQNIDLKLVQILNSLFSDTLRDTVVRFRYAPGNGGNRVAGPSSGSQQHLQ